MENEFEVQSILGRRKDKNGKVMYISKQTVKI